MVFPRQEAAEAGFCLVLKAKDRFSHPAQPGAGALSGVASGACSWETLDPSATDLLPAGAAWMLTPT